MPRITQIGTDYFNNTLKKYQRKSVLSVSSVGYISIPLDLLYRIDSTATASLL